MAASRAEKILGQCLIFGVLDNFIFHIENFKKNMDHIWIRSQGDPPPPHTHPRGKHYPGLVARICSRISRRRWYTSPRSGASHPHSSMPHTFHSTMPLPLISYKTNVCRTISRSVRSVARQHRVGQCRGVGLGVHSWDTVRHVWTHERVHLWCALEKRLRARCGVFLNIL